MAKRGLVDSGLRGLIRDRFKRVGWSLCIGAGNSAPAFPSWRELVGRLIELDVGTTKAPALQEYLLSKYSMDAVIQAAQDRAKLSNEQFAQRLSGILYERLRQKASDREWRILVSCMAAKGPSQGRPSSWETFISWFRRNYPNLTALTLSKVLLQAKAANLAPSAVLSFNAEPLLYALTHAAVAERTYYLSRKQPKGALTQVFEAVTSPISYRTEGRIPYIYCHGALPVPSARSVSPVLPSDQLVFSEAQYLQLANESYSWQSSAFLNAAITSSIVFVGVSLSDPNMRRWLSFVHSERERQLSKDPDYRGSSTKHYWFSVDPLDPQKRNWIESCLAHLGVRVVWLQNWQKLEESLNSLLSI